MSSSARSFDLSIRILEDEPDMDAQSKAQSRAHLDELFDIGLRRSWPNVIAIVYADGANKPALEAQAFNVEKAIGRSYYLTDREVTITVTASAALRRLGEKINAHALVEVQEKTWNKALHWAALKLSVAEQFKKGADRLVTDHQQEMGEALAARAIRVIEQGMRQHLQEIKEMLSPEAGAQFESKVHLIPHGLSPVEEIYNQKSRRRPRP
jgi:hypothetical protein